MGRCLAGFGDDDPGLWSISRQVGSTYSYDITKGLWP